MSRVAMSSRQFFRRLMPVIRSTSNISSAIPAIFRHTAISKNIATRLSCHRCLTTNTAPQIINIQDEDDFQKRVIDASATSSVPIVVDFHATWCGPCKLLGPRLETIIAGEKGKIIMAKVDIDENVDIAMRYNVQSVPTVYGVKNGKIVKSFVGLKDDDEIKSFVQELL